MQSGAPTLGRHRWRGGAAVYHGNDRSDVGSCAALGRIAGRAVLNVPEYWLKSDC
jgi:hypothetical protein